MMRGSQGELVVIYYRRNIMSVNVLVCETNCFVAIIKISNPEDSVIAVVELVNTPCVPQFKDKIRVVYYFWV